MKPAATRKDVAQLAGVSTATVSYYINGSGYVKKRGETSLLSLNPLYEPIPMNDSIRCNGKVVGILKPDWIAE